MGEKAPVDLVMNVKEEFVFPPQCNSFEEDGIQRKQRLAASCRLFGKFGFDEGAAGHITVRDPEHKDHFWVNPMGVSFKQIKVSDLILVTHDGVVVEGEGLLNGAAFTIHSNIHKQNPDIDAAAHSHSVYGKSCSSLGRKLDPITQDACAFYDDHIILEEFTGVVLEEEYGTQIGNAIAGNKVANFSKSWSANRGERGRRRCLVVHHYGKKLSGTIDGRGRRYTEINFSRSCRFNLRQCGQ
jgi:ribulose-5-phosphate 4-epimerase/fuculose-1-phosphate aldolase